MTIPYPPPYQTIINKLLKDEAEEFWREIQERPARSGLRINSGKTFPEVLQGLPVRLDPLPWEENGYLVEATGDLGKHPFHAAGLYYLQEPSAMAAVEVLQPQPGEHILDLAAAPGGKSTQIVTRMNNTGLLLANDPHPGRVQALARNLERWGARQTAITRDQPQRLADALGPIFNRVLVDAPCSGEGMFRSHPGERKRWSPNFVQRCAAQQQEILWYAAKLVKPDGVLVYSTCTFNTRENEQVVSGFLKACPDFSLEEPHPVSGFSPGIDRGENADILKTKSVRIWPHRAPGEGHYIACFHKDPARAERQQAFQTANLPGIDSDQAAEYKRFFDAALTCSKETDGFRPGNPGLHVFGNRLYAVPEGLPPLSGLKVHHWGWWLGTFHHGRFRPSHALAVGIRKEAAQKVLELPVNGTKVAHFLRGLPLDSAGEAGWILITTAGVPLGWGKRANGRLKSFSPSWLH